MIFSEVEEEGDNPIVVQDSFHSQFQLQTDKYQDNNNYFQYHDVFINDHRWWPYHSPHQFKYLTLE